MVNSNSKLPEMRPHHSGIYVTDLESSIKWYQDKFDFTVHRRSYVEGINGKIAFLKRDGDSYIELLEVAGTPSTPEDAVLYGPKGHVGFVVNDFPRCINILKKRGVELIREGKFGPVSLAILKDNSDTMIEIIEKVNPDYYEG